MASYRLVCQFSLFGLTFFAMSAREVIRLFDALPEAERREVADHVLQAQKQEPSATRYASLNQAKEIADRVFTTNEELFRKLAQ
jgi:hypothetical protein